MVGIMAPLAASTRITPYSPVVATTTFEVDFPIFDNADVLLIHNGAEIAFTITASYVDGISTDAVCVVSPGIIGDVMVVGLRAPRRTDQYANGAPLPIVVHNYSLNRLTAEDQEIRRDVDRAVRVEYGESGPLLLPIVEGDTLMGGPNNTIVPGPTADDITGAQGAASAAAASAAAAAAYADLARNNFVVDTWAGDGATTVFTDILTVEPGSANNVLLTVGNALIPVSSYTVVGKTVTFTGGFVPPGDGVEENIQARYGNQIPLVGAPGDGTITPAKLEVGAEAAFRSTLDTYSTDEVDTLVKGVGWTPIPSAASIDLGAANGDFGDITGTNPITSFGTAPTGVERTVRFTGILTLTHNATSLILYSGMNVITYSGLVMRFRSLGSGNWIEVSQTPARGAWTPGIAFGGASVGATYHASNSGSFVKRGKEITLQGYLRLTAKGSSTGAATITGMPAAPSSAVLIGTMNVRPVSGMSGLTVLLGGPAGGGTTIQLTQSAATGSAGVTDANFTDTSWLIFTVTYETA